MLLNKPQFFIKKMMTSSVLFAGAVMLLALSFLVSNKAFASSDLVDIVSDVRSWNHLNWKKLESVPWIKNQAWDAAASSGAVVKFLPIELDKGAYNLELLKRSQKYQLSIMTKNMNYVSCQNLKAWANKAFGPAHVNSDSSSMSLAAVANAAANKENVAKSDSNSSSPVDSNKKSEVPEPLFASVNLKQQWDLGNTRVQLYCSGMLKTSQIKHEIVVSYLLFLGQDYADELVDPILPMVQYECSDLRKQTLGKVNEENLPSMKLVLDQSSKILIAEDKRPLPGETLVTQNQVLVRYNLPNGLEQTTLDRRTGAFRREIQVGDIKQEIRGSCSASLL